MWTGPGPDDACGLAWLAQTLRPWGLEKVSVTQVVLPDFWEEPDGTVVRWTGWGEMEPWMWGRLAQTGRRLPANVLQDLAGTWQDLQKENAPLRAVVKGRLMSVPEDWYDSFLRRRSPPDRRSFPPPRWWEPCWGSTSWASATGNWPVGWRPWSRGENSSR